MMTKILRFISYVDEELKIALPMLVMMTVMVTVMMMMMMMKMMIVDIIEMDVYSMHLINDGQPGPQ